MIGLYVSLSIDVLVKLSMSNGVISVMVGWCRCVGAGIGSRVLRDLLTVIWLILWWLLFGLSLCQFTMTRNWSLTCSFAK